MKISPLIIVSILLSPIVANAGNVETDYSLSLNSFYGYTDYTKPYNKLYKHNNINSSFNFYGRATYEFNEDYATSLVGYLMADTAKEVENYNQGTWGEEVYLLTETPYGEFSIGQKNNVAYEFAVGAPNIGYYRTNNTDLVNFIVNPNWYKKGHDTRYKTLNSTYINTDGVSPKISYVTPSWQGIKLGATYVPKTYSQTGLVAKDAPYKDDEAYILGAYGIWDVLGYEIETSLGYADFENNDTEYSAGISVYRKGWTLGGSYRHTEADTKHYGLDKENLYDSYREGNAYNIGLSYEIGPFTTGVSYFVSEAKKTDNKDEIVSFSNSYQYNKYITLSLTAAHLKAEGDNNEIKNNSKGYAFIFGLELAI